MTLGLLFLGLISLLIHNRQAKKQEPQLLLSMTDEKKDSQELEDSTTSSSPAQNVEGERHLAAISPEKAFEEAFSKKYPSPWNFQKASTGKIFRIMGGPIKGIGNTPKAIEDLAEDLAQMSHVTGQSFSHTSKRTTNLSTTHFITQSFKGFEVYDAYVQATSNKSGDIFIIERFIKDVDKDIPTKILITQQQAMEITAREYSQEANIKKTSTVPKIWAEDSEHELVWEFSVLVKEPELAAYKVVVGALTGRIREKFKESKN